MKHINFTIIELLLVVAIAGILLAVAVPSFSRILQGSGPTRAARELIGKINAARAYAVANKTDVAIIFPQDEITSLTNQLGYQSYRICEVYIQSGTTITFKRWITGENWNYLPSRVLIGKDKNNNNELFFKPGDDSDEKKATTDQSAKTVSYVEDTNAKPTITSTNFNNGIIFRSDGMLFAMQPVLIKIREARRDGNSLKSANNDYLPLVIRFNGKVKAYNEVVSE